MESEAPQFFDLETSLGFLRGEVVSAPNGKNIVKFLGIPYAQQPVGELRFKPLQPMTLPLGTKDEPFLASKHGPAALQELDTEISTVLPTGEDCIHLNIYVPMEIIDKADSNVFFHIHCGGFLVFSGSEPVFDMTNFVARHNCVGVSFNYRLGLLGFLSMPPLIEHNLGLKDQQFALKWTHEHIGSFGGEPKKITLYGCSAGSASCHYHLLNKESSALFQRAIMSSGLINERWGCANAQEQQKRLKWALNRLGCPQNLSPEETLKFLMELDAEAFTKASSNFSAMLKDAPCPVSTFCENQGSLVPLDRKPLLVGVTSDECSFLPDMLAPRESFESGMTKTRQQVSDLLTEVEFFAPLRKFCSEVRAQAPGYPLFAYLFDYTTKTRGETVVRADQILDHFGSYHSLDMAFFMNQFCPASELLPTATLEDNHVNEAMAEMVHMFMNEETDKIDLPIYSTESRKVSRITSEGIAPEDYEFQKVNPKFVMTRIVTNVALLKLFPNKL